jgi:hypothetical protein
MARVWVGTAPKRRKPCDGLCGGQGGDVTVEVYSVYDPTKLLRVETKPCPRCNGSGEVDA